MTVGNKAKSVEVPRKKDQWHLPLFINQLSDSIVDSDPEYIGSESGIIVPDPDLTFFDKKFVLFLQIFLEMV
jgi:hypothetical protein